MDTLKWIFKTSGRKNPYESNHEMAQAQKNSASAEFQRFFGFQNWLNFFRRKKGVRLMLPKGCWGKCQEMVEKSYS